MRNKGKMFMLILAFSMLALMASCGKLDTAKESIKKYGSYSTKMNEVDKYNAYVDLFNVLTGELSTIKNSYAEKHMDEAGNFIPTSDKYAQAFTGITSLVQPAIEKADKGLSTKPKMDIDKDVAAMLDFLKKEISILEEIENYYEEKAFLNDHDEKGKELNVKLLSIYKETDEPIKIFCDKMRILMDETEKEDRKVHEKEGNKITLGMMQFIDAAKEARNLVNDSIAENGSINLTTEKYAEVNTKVSKSLDELKAVSKDSKAIEKEGFSSPTASNIIESFVSKASEFKNASNELYGSFGEDEEAVIDAVENIQSKYSALIDSYNKLR
ncbi:hypothetical protein IGL98_001509 [Enterococcus sp. DIV0840]|uniref:DUF3829 domain-containing protein n=1 Tax=unclassified Enterococcus TaxID=2608891 RepID=UPI001A8EA546|nr:DUF3829 domain-containing protein [Enterococcus sp. DIV0849a]MBO0434178.1 DUF3829 domain-containing protein [Enterococcus sp. DIV0849a]